MGSIYFLLGLGFMNVAINDWTFKAKLIQSYETPRPTTTWMFQQFKQTPPTNLIYYSSFIIFNYVFPIFISLVKNSKLNLENGFNLFSTWVVIHEQSSLLGAILELKWKQYLEDGASFFLLNFSCLKFLIMLYEHSNSSYNHQRK